MYIYTAQPAFLNEGGGVGWCQEGLAYGEEEEGTIVLANLNSSVTGAANESVAMEMQASDVPRVSLQSECCPGCVCSDVPDFDGLVRGPTDNAIVIKLDTRHSWGRERGGVGDEKGGGEGKEKERREVTS